MTTSKSMPTPTKKNTLQIGLFSTFEPTIYFNLPQFICHVKNAQSLYHLSPNIARNIPNYQYMIYGFLLSNITTITSLHSEYPNLPISIIKRKELKYVLSTYKLRFSSKDVCASSI